MATLLFDFDSTIVTCEGLEELLSQKLKGDPKKMESLHEITEKGLIGEIPFSESLRKRLALAAPSRVEAEEYGSLLVKKITPGMEALIEELHSNGVDVWIASGGIIETIYPVSNHLKIPLNHVLAVRLLWEEDGSFGGIDPDCLLAKSKYEGVEPYAKGWSKPIVMVGDSASDYSLYEKGLVDEFILYTQNYRCEKLIGLAKREVDNISELGAQIRGVLHESTTLE